MPKSIFFVALEVVPAEVINNFLVDQSFKEFADGTKKVDIVIEINTHPHS